jgi:hypothetical protein
MLMLLLLLSLLLLLGPGRHGPELVSLFAREPNRCAQHLVRGAPFLDLESAPHALCRRQLFEAEGTPAPPPPPLRKGQAAPTTLGPWPPPPQPAPSRAPWVCAAFLIACA